VGRVGSGRAWGVVVARQRGRQVRARQWWLGVVSVGRSSTAKRLLKTAFTRSGGGMCGARGSPGR